MAFKAPELSVLNNWFQYAFEASKKKRWEWFVIDQFVRGNHDIKGNPEDNSILLTRRTDSVNFPINHIYATLRAIRAFVTRHKPTISVDPAKTSPEALDYARRSNKLLERDNTINNYLKINKEWVKFGVEFGIGWRQIGYDPVKKCAIRWTVDPRDLFIGAKTGKAADAPYIIKTIVRTVDYWKNKYPKSNVTPDDDLAADDYKKLALEMDSESGDSSQETGQRTAIGMECWYKTFKKNSMGGYINKCLFTKTEILSAEETPYEEYPFIPYEAEVEPNELYPDGHVKNMIAPQRMLNLLNAQLLEYNHLVNRGRFMKEKNAGFRVINAKEGQIIEHNPGKRVELLPPPAINPALMSQIDYALRFIQDMGAMQDASRGRLPSSGLSGDAINALQAGDANTISDLRDNFEDALATEAAWILKVYSLFEQDGIPLEEKVEEDKTDQFAVVGAKAYESMGKPTPDKYFMEDNGEYCAVLAILPDNQVKVSIGSQLGESKAARLELLMKLVDMQVLPAKNLLEYLEFPNTSDILERIADEALGGAALNGLQQPPMPPEVPPLPPASVPTPEPNQGVTSELESIASNLGSLE